MAGGAQFVSSARQRIGLSFAKEFLDWLYTDHSSPEQCRFRFWVWFTGVSERQARPQAKGNLDHILSATADWDWPKWQARLRRTVEELLSQVDAPKKRRVPVYGRVLTTWTVARGRRQLLWKPMLPEKPKPEDWMVFALDELLTDLTGVDREAIGRCRECKRYFVRMRARRGIYCSPRCRYKAANANRRRRVEVRQERARRRAAPRLKR